MQRQSRKAVRDRKKKKKLRYVVTIGVLLFLLTSSFGAYAFIKTKNAYDRSQVDLNRAGGKSDLREQDVTFKDPFSILLLGIENYSSGDKSGLADTQIVITIDPASSEVHMVTVPRDTRVNIENAGEYSGIHKLNAAYSYGTITGYGAIKLQVETVEKFLNIPIDNFVAVNFDSFRDIVDALGGVTIDIKEAFWEENFSDRTKMIEFKKGRAHLNGEEALAFVRMRKLAVNAAYPREERQRQFLAATIDQAMSAGTIFKIGEITEILGDNVETDLTAKQIYSLQKQFSKSDNLSIETIEIEGADKMIDRTSYYIPEKESLQNVSIELRNILKLDNNEDFMTNADFVTY
jgi:polyisoprenyl-teichoic acid--peptidoglycan teichoic acid transferase